MLFIIKRTIVIRQSLILDKQLQDQQWPKDRNSQQHDDSIPVGAIASISFLWGIILLIVFLSLTKFVRRTTFRFLHPIIFGWAGFLTIVKPDRVQLTAWIAAGHCVNAMYNLATGKEVKFFPRFYLSSIFFCDNN